ncbi:PilZ domain-containing protein [Silvibacterium dinghuense]|nr:hypothetical protein GCM10011586_35130 [Silvibacterium dinghuense]
MYLPEFRVGLQHPIADVAGANGVVPEELRSRGAVRFPICLPIHVIVGVECYEGYTKDISASGILFQISELLSPGDAVEFFVEIPEGIIGNKQSAAVHCAGRVVRSYREQTSAYAAAVIDHYSFQ